MRVRCKKENRLLSVRTQKNQDNSAQGNTKALCQPMSGIHHLV